ncbi:MAG: hypothetical protein LCH79_06430 [Proteobacteria bacterium]|nr:hypothetical protein [Pseudomonadota bacterium]
MDPCRPSFSFTAHPNLAAQDLKKLQYTAKLTASKIDQAAAKRDEDVTKDWSLVPKPRDAARRR